MQRKIPNINFRNLLSSSSGVDKLKLHSIPKLRMKNVKSNVLYGIPGGCVVALLSVGLVSLAPNLFNLTDSAYAIDQTFGDSTASMTLDTSDVEVKVAPGETGYTSKNISLSISNVKDYALTITAPATLSKESASGDTDTNSTATSWGYAYGQSGNVENMAYTNFTGTAQTLESGNTDTISNKTLALAASFDDNNDIGYYKANIVLALTATPKVAITYTLAYNGNGTNTSNIPTNQTCTAYDNGTCTITLSSTKPTRSGYEFLGWTGTSSATTASYQAGGSITISGDTTLYAVWKSQNAVWSNGTNSGITYMQDITTGTSTNSFCSSSLPTHASITLKDKRDENSYTIVKMADGKCWMTQNLRIMGSRTLTSSDSNVTSNYTLPASSISGFSSYTASNAYLSGSTGYYTWCAATAGTCTSADTDAPSSICPKGWKLPSGGSSGEFNTFAIAEGIANSADGSTKIRGAPYNFAYTGRVSNDSLDYTDARGVWWSRTAGSNIYYAYYLYIVSNSVSPGTATAGRYGGAAVRCVAE